MTERWEHRLRELRVETPPEMWRRIQEGPRNTPQLGSPRRRERVLAAVVALAVFAAAGAFAWRAFGPGPARVGASPPTPSTRLRVYEDPLGWTAVYPADWHVFAMARTSDGLGSGVTFENHVDALKQGPIQDYVVLRITHPLNATLDPSAGSSSFPLSASDFKTMPGGLNASVLDFTIQGIRYEATLMVGASAHLADITAVDKLIASIRPSVTGSPPTYSVTFPKALTQTDTGLEVVATTNLPEGTLYLVNVPNGGACCPAVHDGQMVVSMNDAGQIDTSQAQGCRALRQGDLTQASDLQITITVDSEIGKHVWGAWEGQLPRQPDSVVAILGAHFENLTGDQVVQTGGGNRLVASATYPWPEPRC